MPDKPAVAPAAPAAPADDDLAKKQKALTEAQTQITTLNQTVASLQEEIRVLTQKAAEVKQATAGYDTLQKSMQSELDDDQSQIAKMRGIAEAVLKETTKQIDTAVAEFDKKLTDGDTEVGKAKGISDAATTASTAADEAVKVSQAKYDALKNGTSENAPKYNQAALKKIADLLTSTAKAETLTDFVSVYFLTGEAKKKADANKLLSPNDYTKALTDAQAELDTAKADAKEKKKKADEAVAAYTTANQNQAAKWQSRITDVQAVLKAISQKPAPGRAA